MTAKPAHRPNPTVSKMKAEVADNPLIEPFPLPQLPDI
jgi:hypothetical protein